MGCLSYREAISARLDGEPLGMPVARLDEHLAGCAACTVWAREAARVTRRARLAAAPPVPDLTTAVLAALPRELPGTAAAARAHVVETALRLALLAVGVAQAGLAWPVLVSGAGAMSAPVHMAHETGAWNLAVAAAFLGVAAAPRLAAGRAAVPGLVRRAPGAGHGRRPGRRPRAGRPGGGPPAADHRRRAGGHRRLAGTTSAGGRRGAHAGARVRRSALLVALLGGLLLTGVGTAGPASAHATLVTTNPAEGARLETAPDLVTLEFSESVSLGAGYARVVTADNERVDTGAATVDDGVLTIPLRGDLPDDGYLVTYRVVSADSHPISGAFSFVVGDGELVAAGASSGEGDVDPVVAAALPAARWIGFGGMALAIGIPALALLCWPGGWASTAPAPAGDGGHRRGRRLGRRRPAPAGPVRRRVRARVDVRPRAAPRHRSASGWAGRRIARLLLVAGLWLALRPAWRRGEAPSQAGAVVAGLLALALVASTAAVGHPVAGPWPVLAVVVAAVHVGAMSVWLGGLTGLLAVVLQPATPAEDVAATLTRFSRLAFGAVVALVVSGIVQTVREVASPTALVSTSYGRILMVKIAFVLVALGAAGVSRVWVQQRLGVHRSRPGGRRSLTAHAFAASSPPETDGRRPGGRGRRCPPAPAVGERGRARARPPPVRAGGTRCWPPWSSRMSAVLVATPPARSALAQPVDVTLPLQGTSGAEGSVQISVDPAQPGPNVLHIYLFDDAGQLTQPAGIEVTLTEPSQQLGPIDVDLQPGGPGHYVGDGMSIPGAGTWTLAVSVRVDEFTATTAQTTFPVRYRPVAEPHNWSSVSLPFRRLAVLALATLTALAASVAVAGVASAHVTVSSTDAAPGGFGKLTFRVPNESDAASTVSLRIQIPPEAALASLRAQPVPGWTVTLTESNLDEPLDNHGQQITTYVSIVEFRAEAGGGIGPGEFQEFALSGGPFPDVEEITLPALQGYSDGSEVAWIEPTVDGQEPEHPAPVLTLTAAGDGATPAHGFPGGRLRRRGVARGPRAVPRDPRAAGRDRGRRPRVAGAASYRVVVSPAVRVRRRPAVPALLLAVGLALAGCGSTAVAEDENAGHGHDSAATVEGPEDRYAGVDLPEPYRRPSFTLTDTTGAEFDFTDKTGGRPTLLFFGYTNCPDVCPATMADIAVAMRGMDPAVAEQVQVVFVTTDPAFDSPGVLGEYLDRFDADLPTQFIGLTGDQELIDQAQLSAGVPLAEDDGRLHSSLLLLYGTDDEAPVAFDAGNTARDIAADLALVVAGS